MNKSGHQVKSGLKTDGPMTNILIVPMNVGELARHRHEVWIFGIEHLNSALFIK
ncbi:MAG: hypothetical protein BWX50_01622 [Euryarchaeota archaeon ADurb.Bin009]|nr:MAG: hypothetical protein BWX50_01622 [Euryarchaeota archaeon ADurb.Bin009]